MRSFPWNEIVAESASSEVVVLGHGTECPRSGCRSSFDRVEMEVVEDGAGEERPEGLVLGVRRVDGVGDAGGEGSGERRGLARGAMGWRTAPAVTRARRALSSMREGGQRNCRRVARRHFHLHKRLPSIIITIKPEKIEPSGSGSSSGWRLSCSVGTQLREKRGVKHRNEVHKKQGAHRKTQRYIAHSNVVITNARTRREGSEVRADQRCEARYHLRGTHSS